MPPHPSTGTSGTRADMPSAPGATGAQPGMRSQPSTGASATRAGSSGASGTGSSSQAAPEMEAMLARLQPKTENGVSYVCGGVGQEEVAYLKKEARKHDLMLTFAAVDREALADVNVEIADARGNPVLRTTCDGPMMLVDLPKPGTYRVVADASGYKQGQTVTVKGRGQKGQQVALAWPAKVAQIHGPTETATGSSGTTGTGAGGSR
jgi:hypothetical protein